MPLAGLLALAGNCLRLLPTPPPGRKRRLGGHPPGPPRMGLRPLRTPMAAGTGLRNLPGRFSNGEDGVAAPLGGLFGLRGRGYPKPSPLEKWAWGYPGPAALSFAPALLRMSCPTRRRGRAGRSGRRGCRLPRLPARTPGRSRRRCGSRPCISGWRCRGLPS